MSETFLTAPIDPTAAKNLADKGLSFRTIPSTDDLFEPWFQAVVRGFNDVAINPDVVAERVSSYETRRVCGVWDESGADARTPVATASSWVMPLVVNGNRDLPSWAISTITVAPTHRRRGIARNLLEAELRTAASLGVPVAILTASEATIYERYGFAPAALTADWTIQTSRAKWIGRTPGGRVQLVPREEVRDTAFELLHPALSATPGQVKFDGLLWERLFGLKENPNTPGMRVARYDDEAGTQQGFAIYRAVNEGGATTVNIAYLTAATDDAYAALWRYLLELDLVDTVSAKLRSTDEPFRWQLSDARAAHEDHVGDHLWLRILDVKETLEGRQYSAPGTFVFEITDDLGFAAGMWLLSIDDSGTATVRQLENTDGFDDNHRLSMTVNELAAGYLGATKFGTLVRAGRVIEKTPAAAVAADAAFRSEVTPWLSIWF